MASQLDREKLDNLHLRLRDLERLVFDATKALAALHSEVRAVRLEIADFKQTYLMTLYHAVVRRVLSLTGSDLRNILLYISLLTLVLYALVAGLNLFTSGILPALLGGVK